MGKSVSLWQGGFGRQRFQGLMCHCLLMLYGY